MTARPLLSIVAAAVIVAGGAALAQDKPVSGEQPPPAQQSAPADSSHASGHDVQTGKPESGEVQNNEPHAGSGQTKREAETTGGASTPRLDVPPSDLKR